MMTQKILRFVFSFFLLFACARKPTLKDFSHVGADAVELINLVENGSDYHTPDNCRYLGPAKIAGEGYQKNFTSQEFNLREKIFSYGANLGVIRDYTDRMAYVELYFCSARYQ